MNQKSRAFVRKHWPLLVKELRRPGMAIGFILLGYGTAVSLSAVTGNAVFLTVFVLIVAIVSIIEFWRS